MESLLFPLLTCLTLRDACVSHKVETEASSCWCFSSTRLEEIQLSLLQGWLK